MPAAAAAEPESPEVRDIKERFYKVFPQFKVLADAIEKDPEVVAKMVQALDVVPQVRQDSEQRWVAAGHAALRSLAAEGAKIYGVEALSPEASKLHQASFINWLEQDPELRQRYMDGDTEALVKEYWQAVNKHMLDPIRRSAAAQAQARGERIRRVPTSGPGTGVVGQGGAPKPKTEDELHDQAWDALQAARTGS